MEKFPGILKKDGRRWVLNDEQRAWMERYYPVTVNRDMCQALGISKRSLERIKGRLGLSKGAEGMKKTREEAGRLCSETERNLGKAEVRREIMGLTRKTRWHVVMNKFTISQKNHSHQAFIKGYILPDGHDLKNRYVIWWDEDTKRGERFESNLARNGFVVKRYEDDSLDEKWEAVSSGEDMY